MSARVMTDTDDKTSASGCSIRVAVTMTCGKASAPASACANSVVETKEHAKATGNAAARTAKIPFFIKIKTINKTLTVFPDSAWALR